MLTVCDGWTSPPHARIVLSGTDDGSPVSNGLCKACEAAMLTALDNTADRRTEIDSCPFDPRPADTPPLRPTNT